MSGETVYLLEAIPLDNSGTATNVNFAMGLRDEAELKSAGVYPLRLTQAYTHETSIFEDNVPGQTNVSLGSATIANADGRFDYLLNYAWDNRPLTIKRGRQGDAYGTYSTEFVGATTEITADTNFLTLTLKDNSFKLLKPLQTHKYAGTGGSEGGADLQNKFKPLLFGKTRNLAPIWVDQTKLTLQIHDGPLTSVDFVYDRANQLTFFLDYVSYAQLVAAVIPPGFYGTCLTEGFIRLGAPPAGTLTADAVGMFGSVTNIPELAKQLLTTRLGLLTTELDIAAFTQASSDAPWVFEGIFYPEPQLQYDEIIETLSNMVNGFWYVTRTGLISFKIFKFSTPVASIRAQDLMSLGKAPSPAPLFRVKVDYAKNATIQPPSDFTIPKQLLNAYLDKMYHYVDTSVGSPDYSGAGKFHVFLNGTEINDLSLASFSVPNGESWVTINSTGDITVTAPPTTIATAILRVNLGEFAWDEPFTVVKDSTAPLNKIDLSLSTDRIVFDDAGQPTPLGQSVVVTATGSSTTPPITVTAVDNLGSSVAVTGGTTISAANVSSSVLVQWVEVRAADANGVQQRKRFVVQHGNDAYAQGILGSFAAQGATFFFQTTAPTTGMLVNDIWVDTDDTNKTYRWTGTVWAAFSDSRIVDALVAAAGAQATADGKIKTYVNTSTPSGIFSLGDLWYNPTTQELKRWDGSAWSDIVSTVGAAIGVNLTNGGSVVSGPAIVNSAVTINADGTLVGAGGGQVTYTGIGGGAYGDINRVRMSKLEKDLVGWTGFQRLGTPTITSFTANHNDDDYLWVQGSFTGATQNVTIANNSDVLGGGNKGYRIPVTAGERLLVDCQFNVSSMPAAGRWYLWIEFFDDANTLCGTPTTVGGIVRTTTSTGWELVPGFVVVPTGAVSYSFEANIDNLGVGTATGAFSLKIKKPMVCSAGPGQTVIPPFTPGPSNESGAELNRIVDGPPQSTSFAYDYTGAAIDLAGGATRDLTFKLNSSTGQITSGVTWTYTVKTGTVNGFTSASGAQTMSVASGTGTITVASLSSATASIQVTATYQGLQSIKTFDLVQATGSPPITSGGGGGGSVTIDSDTTFTSFNSTTFTTVSTMSGVLPSGHTQITINAIVTASPVSAGGNYSGTVELKILRDNGGGSFTQIGSTQTSPASYTGPTGGDPADITDANFSYSVNDTGLTAGNTYTYVVQMRQQTGTKAFIVTGHPGTSEVAT